MRLKGLSLLLLILLPAQGFEITIILNNYEKEAMLRIFNDTALLFEGTVISGDIITIPEGNYTLELNALNKTFIKRLNVDSDKRVEFNLGFTSSTEDLTIMLHSIVAQNGSVDEVIIISNRGKENFEGNLTIPMPIFSNLQIIAKNLDFLDLETSMSSITFNSLLVPENGSGSIRIAYDLATDEMKRELKKERVIIIPIAEVLEYQNLSYKIEDFNEEKIILLEGNGSYYIKFKFVEYSESPLPLVAIILISISLFLLFFEKRGRWKE
ncbi:MAG: hypothetical protein NZ879_00500 [Archaeoglobaceae archaeon]|nr:hypothetical protein [Archaeoglobaceae archaeon]MDW8117448.1 hypothetical protein [Archaeoglobaceae archaeon]